MEPISTWWLENEQERRTFLERKKCEVQLSLQFYKKKYRNISAMSECSSFIGRHFK